MGSAASLSSTCKAYLPAGTDPSASTSLTPGFARSSNDLTAEEVGAVATARRLVASTCSLPLSTNPALIAASMLSLSAVASTSARAPSRSCVTSTCDPAKLYDTDARNCAFISLKASWRDDAAKTTTASWLACGGASPQPARRRTNRLLRSIVAYRDLQLTL